MPRTILRIDASARRAGSVSRDLVTSIVDRFAETGDVTVLSRDLAKPIPQIDETWIEANFTSPEKRTPEQARALRLSDTLVEELQAADVLVIGLPIYNFGVPASFKAWVDQIARAGITFRYSETGPRGLLAGKRAIVVVASGGTEAGSDTDFATGFVRHVLGFIGIEDVVFVKADRMMLDADGTMKSARDEVAALSIAA